MRPLVAGLLLVGVGALGMAFIKKPSPVSTPRIGTQPGGVAPGRVLPHFQVAPGHKLAAFSAGCFWGVEETYRRIPGVVATAVGYSGGRSEFPDYTRAHADGHAETVLVEFDPGKVSYGRLLEAFWKLRYPTSPDGKDPHPNSAYRSAIWTFDDAQQREAQATRSARQKVERERILTRILPHKPFYLAEEHHQQYDEKAEIRTCALPD